MYNQGLSHLCHFQADLIWQTVPLTLSQMALGPIGPSLFRGHLINKYLYMTPSLSLFYPITTS